MVPPGLCNRLAKLTIREGVTAYGTVQHPPVYLHRLRAEVDDLLEVLLGYVGAGYHGSHFLLLFHLPVNVLLNIRVVQIEGDHLGSPAGGRTGFDASCGPAPALMGAARRRGLAAPAV